jgi:hypothetical protein
VESTRNDLGEEIRRLEENLLTAAVRHEPAALERLLATDFVEHGSSGGVFDRDATIRLLAQEKDRAITLENYRLRELAPGVALATYRAGAEGRWSRRASIWIHRDGRWQLAFHQGTAIPPAP